MRREYFRARPLAADVTAEPDGENYLARTVHETFDLVDIGILDEDGNRIMARRKMDAVGFIRWPEQSE